MTSPTPDLLARYRRLVGGEPDPGSTYRLAKRGVLRLCERAALRWGERGGRVVSLSPGLIDTAMGRLELEHSPIKTWMAELTPVGGGRSDPDGVLPGLTADIANAVTFLCSEQAAFISGCDLRVDGGVVEAMLPSVAAGSTVVVHSTVHPGTCEALAQKLADDALTLADALGVDRAALTTIVSSGSGNGFAFNVLTGMGSMEVFGEQATTAGDLVEVADHGLDRTGR